MVKITEDLIRRRAEHNECVISTLEEISLHQQDIERIEWIDKWCRDLKILYLQSNLIPKIEHVGRLKKLEYLNLALNNVEKIENLQDCESLKKLDLTLNFVGELTSVECLRHLVHLRELYLTGNPCAQYEGYRQFVIATLPQLQSLDGLEIEKSERIIAVQALQVIRGEVLTQQEKYIKKRLKDKAAENGDGESVAKSNDGRWYTDINMDSSDKTTPLGEDKSEEDKEKEFWEEKVPYTPESRIKVHEHMMKQRERDEQKSKPGPDPPKRERRLMGEDGRMFNTNEAQIDFELKEDDDNNQFLLDVAIYKHMDTSLCEVDVQPSYVRVIIKGKVLQLVLMEEVRPDSSTAKRSQITGHLLITMPKVKQIIKPLKIKQDKLPQNTANSLPKANNRTQMLEVDPTVARGVDLTVVQDHQTKPRVPLLGSTVCNQIPVRENSDNFEDDPDVPPLI